MSATLSNPTSPAASTITPADLACLQDAGQPIELIDVRTGVEYRQVHARGARLVSLDRLQPAAIVDALPPEQKTQPIYLICKSGQRAAKAAERFRAAGITSAIVVEGGTAAWESAGLPVVRGQAGMSLERQVRIAAGLLILLGIVLARWVWPWFIGLSAFVGAGLILAGVTDWCGMGLMLAKMPWNRGSAESCCAPGQSSNDKSCCQGANSCGDDAEKAGQR